MHSHNCPAGHRHSIFCLLPPHVLREIARRGTPAQRDAVLKTLALDGTMRAQRLTLQLLVPVGAPAIMAATAATPKVNRTIYSAQNSQDLPGTLMRGEGQPEVADRSVNEAYEGLGATFAFYLEIYRRNSIDDRGLPLVATVHYDQNYDNAFWNGRQMIFGDGDGQAFNRFTAALDVIGHELTHGVTGSEVNLTYMQQSGALNESISDVFGSLVKQYRLGQTVDQADWLIGAGLLTFPNQALRSMREPGTAYDNALMGRDQQPADMAHYVETFEDNGGVHINSGIPNRAFFLVADALKGVAPHAWEKAGQIWYDTIRDTSLKPSADFAAFAGRTIANAGHRYGTRSEEQKAVTDAWKTVGVTPS